MKHVIHIYGASGSGTSTLGKALAKELGWRWMDSDDYFWMPTDPPYTTKRSIPERINLMERDIFDAHQAFLKWAAGYDEGGLDTRSRARHDEWEKGLSCPIVRVNGMDKVQENVEKVKAVLKNNQKYAAQMS